MTFRLQTRDLSETFGSPLGAQLVDVYVRVPGASTTSTAAAHPLRNFTIAPTMLDYTLGPVVLTGVALP